MLDLSTRNTKNVCTQCVKEGCDVLRHTSAQRARCGCRSADSARCACCGAAITLYSSGDTETMKPVRQCARRCQSGIVVAQASPLCSDNAPREVHLWQ